MVDDDITITGEIHMTPEKERLAIRYFAQLLLDQIRREDEAALAASGDQIQSESSR